MDKQLRPIRTARFVFGAALGIAGTCWGANLVVNPAFTGGVSPWVPSPSATLTSDSRDEAGATSSGSARVSDSLGNESLATISQCIAISPSVHYRFRADIMLPTGQAPSSADAYLYGYSTSNCTGPSLSSTGLILADFVPQRDDWQRIRNENVFVDNANFHSVILYLGIYKTSNDLGAIAANWDNVVLEPGVATGPCVPNNKDLCLSDFRFRVRAHWETSQNSDDAHSIQLTPDSGVFTFFDPGNVEVQLKVLNACSFSPRFWVFASGTTNVGVVITVMDTKTGTVKAYSNALNSVFQPILDTNAFACP